MGHTANVLKKTVQTVSPQSTVLEAAKAMKKAKIGSLLVGDASAPEGIFTERDIARRVVADGLDPARTRVEEVMSKKLVTLDAAEPLEKVFDCLALGHFRHLPITENGRIVGIVSLTDLAKMLKELAREGRFLESFSGKMES